VKIKVVDPGVFRFEPEANDVPAWNLSKQELLAQGWSTSLVDLVAPHLRSEHPRPTDIPASASGNLTKG